MNILADKLTKYIIKKKLISSDDYSFYSFGFKRFLELILNIVCSFLLASFLDMKLECLFFFLIFIPTRSYTGGLHMNNYYICMVFSCITLLTILCFVKFIPVYPYISVAVFILSVIIIKIIGFVDHPDKPISKGKNIIFKRRLNIILLYSSLIFILLIIKNLYDYLLLESLIFLLISITMIAGRLKYAKST